jgi:hypothetical protein
MFNNENNNEEEEEYPEEEEYIIEPFNEEGNIITEFLCNMIEYIVNIPTLIYSITWIKLIKNIIPDNNKIFKYNHQNLFEKNPPICFNLLYWKDKIINWSKFNIGRAIIFLGSSKICCGKKKDHIVFCVIIKILISFTISTFFIFKLPKAIKKYENEGIKSIYQEEIKNSCNRLFHLIDKFYYFEYYYICFIFFICFLIIFLIFLVFINECWIGRGYQIN